MVEFLVDLKLSIDQKKVLDKLLEWYFFKKEEKYITLGGYAGTGKTTLISVLRNNLHQKDKKLKVAFASYTGKAVRVLKNKLVESNSIYKQDLIGTIHSLIYSPIINSKKEITGWKRKEELEAKLIIIDEASMIDEKIWDDLLDYHIPIIAIGDHGQLPPINGSFNLMEDPILKLEQIHRQAENNPIIKLSTWAREKGQIPSGVYGPGIKKILKRDLDSAEEIEELLRSRDGDTLILCGYNSTRVKLNEFIRNSREFNPFIPEVGDRVICLKNNHSAEIYNGMLGTINSLESKNDDWFKAEIKMDDDLVLYDGLIAVKQFNNKESLNFTKNRRGFLEGDLFDYGYALTVHKAQGSQARRVILFEERFPKIDEKMWRKWLYTAITRAVEELIIIG